MGVGPFDDVTVRFGEVDLAPRRAVVVLGGGGVGKTSLLAAIASTRPGYAVPQPRRAGDASPAHVETEWILGSDDPGRPHPLRVTSPNAPSASSPASANATENDVIRRREQTLFDRRAADGGFVVVAFGAARWFSKSPIVLTHPERSVLRYDVRAPAAFDDATRTDLARETKQTLTYAAIAQALSASAGGGETPTAARLDDDAFHEVVGGLVAFGGYAYVGADAATLEPIFRGEGGARVPFDELPTGIRHLVAIGALIRPRPSPPPIRPATPAPPRGSSSSTISSSTRTSRPSAPSSRPSAPFSPACNGSSPPAPKPSPWPATRAKS